jgi:uncharacterized protein YcgL (UPF0745 family)
MSQGPFGDDAFSRRAEKLARFFGTPRYILASPAHQDKDVTEQVAKLTREIHALLTQRSTAA